MLCFTPWEPCFFFRTTPRGRLPGGEGKKSFPSTHAPITWSKRWTRSTHNKRSEEEVGRGGSKGTHFEQPRPRWCCGSSDTKKRAVPKPTENAEPLFKLCRFQGGRGCQAYENRQYLRVLSYSRSICAETLPGYDIPLRCWNDYHIQDSVEMVV